MKVPSSIKSDLLKKKNSNIWSLGAECNYDYSSNAVEEYLKDVIENAKDLSSQSPELAGNIVNWASEYHLSSQRANILRALNFEGIRNVLELGAGCGAISRYLGELGINLDAVEGSPRRAEIARLRCQDLLNVNVIVSDFNDLKVPHRAYDAALLIGVLECAKRFMPNAIDDEDAVISILSKARSMLKKEGLLFISIENRMGLKYWQGASEDHYALPYMGLYGYPKNQGIRTYDRRQWEAILRKTDIKYYRFFYPFPDYKLAKVILSDKYIKTNEYAHSVLYRISPRDYERMWMPNSDTFLILRSLHQSGYLEDFANSFFIAISDSVDRLNDVVPYDFVHFSDSTRKPVYQIYTMKPWDKDYIVKKKINQSEVNIEKGFIQQDISKSKYIKGPLLSSLWIQSVVECENTLTFEDLIRSYYNFIIEYFKKHEDLSVAFDIVPSNIIVDNTGSYRVIDKEWIIRAETSAEYILFRALMWFSDSNEKLLKNLYKLKDIRTIKGFIEYGFSLFSLKLDERLDEFIHLEERIQKEISFQKEPDGLSKLLTKPFSYQEMVLQTKTFTAGLYWTRIQDKFCKECRVNVSGLLGSKRQVLIFKLPYQARNARWLKFEPSECPGFFHLYNISLKWYSLAGTEEKILWQLQCAPDIAENSLRENVQFCATALGELFLSNSHCPQIVFELTDALRADLRKLGEGNLQFQVEMDWPKSADYIIVADIFIEKVFSQSRQIEEQSQQINGQLQQIHLENEYIQKIHTHIDSFKAQLNAERIFHDEVLNSTSWKVMAPVRWLSSCLKNCRQK